MKLIQTPPSDQQLIVELATVAVDVEALQRRIDEATMLPIDPSADDMDDIIRQMQQVTDYLAAAKKGLGLTNSIKAPDKRAAHKSQVMTNMNRIRAKYKRIERMFDEWWENHRAGSDRRAAPAEPAVEPGVSATGRDDDTRVS